MNNPNPNPADELTHAELREKIKSKIEVARFFAGFLTVFIALSSKDLAAAFASDDSAIKWAARVSVLAGLASLGLTFCTISAFDSLLMPRALWKDSGSYTEESVRDEMMRLWGALYWPAVGTLFIAIVLLFYVVSGSDRLLASGVVTLMLVGGWYAFVTRESLPILRARRSVKS